MELDERIKIIGAKIEYQQYIDSHSILGCLTVSISLLDIFYLNGYLLSTMPPNGYYIDGISVPGGY